MAELKLGPPEGGCPRLYGILKFRVARPSVLEGRGFLLGFDLGLAVRSIPHSSKNFPQRSTCNISDGRLIRPFCCAEARAKSEPPTASFKRPRLGESVGPSRTRGLQNHTG